MKRFFNLLFALCITSFVTAQTSTSLGVGAGNAGAGNTSIGYQAGNTIIAHYNTFIGYRAGLNASFSNYNTFLGTHAGRGTVNGSYNVFLGTDAGHSNASGNSNVYIGREAGYASTGNGNIFIGNAAGYNELGSNKLYIANSPITNPLIYGDFAAQHLNINGSLQTNYLTVDPQDNTNEGGEILLTGAGTYQGWNVDNYQGSFRIANSSSTPFIITSGGNIGIGTATTGSFKVAVEGKLGAREIQVTNAPVWPDYVFVKDYKLLSLEEVESYIQKNKHLPEVPSAKIVEKEGFAVGKMNAILLRKIEELTLYVIQQNKINAKQAKVIENLQKQVETLRKTQK